MHNLTFFSNLPSEILTSQIQFLMKKCCTLISTPTKEKDFNKIMSIVDDIIELKQELESLKELEDNHKKTTIFIDPRKQTTKTKVFLATINQYKNLDTA